LWGPLSQEFSLIFIMDSPDGFPPWPKGGKNKSIRHDFELVHGIYHTVDSSWVKATGDRKEREWVGQNRSRILRDMTI
jgi:hypothetical protein